MKKYFYLFALLLLSATVFTSCSDESKSDDLVGQWRGVSYHSIETYEDETYEDEGSMEDELLLFKSNGNFEYYEEDDGDWEFDGMGTYTYKDGKLKLKYDGEGDEYIETYNVKSLTSDRLVLEYKETDSNYSGKITFTFRKVNIDLD